MASKNKPDDLLNEGFHPSQFGKADTQWNAFAQAVLDETAIAVEERVTSAQYGSADPAIARHVTRAERFLACADLWQRRINRMEAETVIGADAMVRAANLKEFRANKLAYEESAERELAAVPSATSASSSTSSAPAFGAVSSSTFEK